jgi:hypothetical protein
MDGWLSGINTRRYINISQLVSGMNPPFIDFLPGFHPFTGLDVTSVFMNKGKLKPFKLMNKDSNVEVFSALGTTTDISNKVFIRLEMFVCGIYMKAHMSNLDDVRYAYFQQHYAPKINDYSLEKIIGINPCSMSPCKAVLTKQILRANYMAYIWENANSQQPHSTTTRRVPHSKCHVMELDTSPKIYRTPQWGNDCD